MTSGSEKIDDFIQEIQLKTNEWDDVVFEWIPYYQFKNNKVIGEDNCTTMYSAIWESDKLYRSEITENYTRDSNKKVVLKYLYSQNTVELLNEVT